MKKFVDGKQNPTIVKKAIGVPKPSDSEIDFCFEKLVRCVGRPEILSITELFGKFIAKALNGEFPTSLSEIAEESMFETGLGVLLQYCKGYKLPLATKIQLKAVEEATKKQSLVKLLWNLRITLTNLWKVFLRKLQRT